jgi:hypothetical protein
MIFLHRERNPPLPEAKTQLDIDAQTYEADFVKVALNVVRLPPDPLNRLPQLLRTWFGPDAGRPGTRHEVRIEEKDGRWTLTPVGAQQNKPQLWHRYSREQIPALFGLRFSTAIWNTGFVVQKNHVFLLVTLDKRGKAKDFQYRDRFLSPDLFQWQSQNRTRLSDKHGQLIQTHRARGIPVHLFVRKTSKLQGRGSAPFVYCGDVDFVDWDGEQPVTVRWRLPEGLTHRISNDLKGMARS